MREELIRILVVLGAMWIVFVVDLLLPWDFTSWGLEPRKLDSLGGVLFMPLLHNSWGHLWSNTVALGLMLVLLTGSRDKHVRVVLLILFISGLIVWVAGMPGVHVGASGLVYGLMTFLIVTGIRERRLMSMTVAIVVGCLYGGMLLWGVLPLSSGQIAWDTHLAGIAAGAFVSWLMIRRRNRKKKIEVADVT
ncbi:MAG: rhomboid family intramembrane serine protease [Planctomyces sp.]|nr:rhomboid family intramembrane serine protease [Planctomyces sp.]